MLGGELSADCDPISGGLAVEILITGAAGDAVHGGHPEVVSINTSSPSHRRSVPVSGERSIYLIDAAERLEVVFYVD